MQIHDNNMEAKFKKSGEGDDDDDDDDDDALV
jgi:hypothetical protein